MLRPASITTFERCYLGAWLIGLINTLAHWNATMAALEANPATARLGASFAVTMLIGGLVIGAVITFALWYFTARQASVVAKWIVTILIVIGAVFFLFGLATTGVPTGANAVVGVVQLVLQIIAVVMLFRPDARAWFGENAEVPLA